MLSVFTFRELEEVPVEWSPNRPVEFFTGLRQNHPPLFATGFLLLGTLGLGVLGLLVDPRMIEGAPTWLKPVKFSLSTAIYSFTLLWIFGYLAEWRQTRRLAGWTTALVFVLEVGIVYLQAWRGKTSYFNVGTPLDGILFGFAHRQCNRGADDTPNRGAACRSA
jgi:hypothetical protein